MWTRMSYPHANVSEPDRPDLALPACATAPLDDARDAPAFHGYGWRNCLQRRWRNPVIEASLQSGKRLGTTGRVSRSRRTTTRRITARVARRDRTGNQRRGNFYSAIVSQTTTSRSLIHLQSKRRSEAASNGSRTRGVVFTNQPTRRSAKRSAAFRRTRRKRWSKQARLMYALARTENPNNTTWRTQWSS